MSKGVGSGDKLARGMTKATFPSTEGGVTAEKWNNIFDTFDPEEFKNAPNKSSQRSGDAGSDQTGVSSTELGTVGPSEPTTV